MLFRSGEARRRTPPPPLQPRPLPVGSRRRSRPSSARRAPSTTTRTSKSGSTRRQDPRTQPRPSHPLLRHLAPRPSRPRARIGHLHLSALDPRPPVSTGPSLQEDRRRPEVALARGSSRRHRRARRQVRLAARRRQDRAQERHRWDLRAEERPSRATHRGRRACRRSGDRSSIKRPSCWPGRRRPEQEEARRRGRRISGRDM